MRKSEIKKYISWLNQGKNQDLVFTRRVSPSVDQGVIWRCNPVEGEGIYSDLIRYHFFFIKNKVGLYVGAILDTGQDLHWYILKDHRKQGYLTKSLKETILPHLFLEMEP